jgi:hypothetical protein
MGYVNGVCMVFIVSEKSSLHPSPRTVLSWVASILDGVIVASYLSPKHLRYLFSL